MSMNRKAQYLPSATAVERVPACGEARARLFADTLAVAAKNLVPSQTVKRTK